MKHFIVINPHSFQTSEKIERFKTETEKVFASERVDEYKVHTSRYKRDAVAAVNRYVRSVPQEETVRVYAVGGDGILFDCLNGMVDFPNAELTSVPYGKANDFVRAFGEKAAPAFRDIKKLMHAPARPVDIISYGTNFALNQANIGLIGLSMIYSNRVLRNPKYTWSRHFASQLYTLGGFAALTDKEVMHQQYSILMDGEDISSGYSNIHIANGPCNGANLVCSPYAVPDDGLLDVIFADETGLLTLGRAIGDYTGGKFEKHRIFHRRRCKTLKVNSELPLRVELDGESFNARDITLEIIPNGIKFFAPEGYGFADYSYRAYTGSDAGKGGNSL